MFIKGYILPEPLDNFELYALFTRMHEGDLDAKEKIVEHNIRLVLMQVCKRFNTVQWDKGELVCIGILGLLKAIDTYNIQKGVDFGNYASVCIYNEINMFLRKIKRNQNVDSFETVTYVNKEGNTLRLEDSLIDDKNFEEDYIENEVCSVVRSLIEELPDRERETILMSYGFYDDNQYIQKEIAKRIGVSQAQVSRIKAKGLKKLKKRLKDCGIIE